MLNDKDLDQIEIAMQALVDAYEKQGKVAMFAYYVETQDSTIAAHVLSTPAEPQHYLDAISNWGSISSDHVNNYLSDDED